MPIDPALDPLFENAGKQYNVDPNMLRAIALQESGANPATADSSAGAQGIMQLMPGTAKGLGVSDPRDPAQAIPAAAKLLSQRLGEAEALKAGGQDVDPASYAVMSYFGGAPGPQWGPKTYQYGQDVAAKYRSLAPPAAPSDAAGSPAAQPAVPTAQLPPDLVRLAAAGVSDVEPGLAAPGYPRVGTPAYTAYAQQEIANGVAPAAAPQAPAGPAGGPSLPPAPNPSATASGPSAPAAGADALDPRLRAFVSGAIDLLPQPQPQPPTAAPTPAAGSPAAMGAPLGGVPAMPTPPPGAAALDSVEGRMARIQYYQQHGLPDLAGEEQKALDQMQSSGQVPYRMPDGSVAYFPIAGGAGDPTRIQRQAAATASGQAQAQAPYETVEATVQGPNGPMKMQIPKDLWERQMRGAQSPLATGAPPVVPPPPGARAAASGGAAGGASGPAGGLPIPPPTGALTGTPVPPLGYDQATKRVDEIGTAAAGAQEDLATIQSMRDLMARNNLQTGWGADARAEAARMLTGLGVKPEDVQNLTAINPADADAFSKQSLRLMAGAVRQMGAREPGSVISLFAKNYPSLETQPQALDLMTNILAMNAQRAQDRRDAVIADWRQGGSGYDAMVAADAAFDRNNPATNYMHAAEAMSPAYARNAWSGVANDTAGQRRIQSLIPLGRGYTLPDGAPGIRRPTAAAPAAGG